MKLIQDYTNLIEQLKKLYFKVSYILLKYRLKYYRDDTINTTQYSIEKNIIDKVNKIQFNNKKNDYVLTKKNSITKSEIANYIYNDKKKNVLIERHILSRLSNHLSSKNNANETNPAIRDKLEKSIWEHIHKAIRYARENNNAYARVNADIANNALKVIANYMTDKQFQLLFSKIKQELQC